MKEDFTGLIYKCFEDDLYEWIDFVCRCRDEEEDYLQYDQIAFITQRAIAQLLCYESFYEVV